MMKKRIAFMAALIMCGAMNATKVTLKSLQAMYALVQQKPQVNMGLKQTKDFTNKIKTAKNFLDIVKTAHDRSSFSASCKLNWTNDPNGGYGCLNINEYIDFEKYPDLLEGFLQIIMQKAHDELTEALTIADKN